MMMSSFDFNKDELWEGRVFKNYTNLCRCLGLKIYKIGSCAYEAQVKRLNSVCRWRKDLDENGKKLSNRIFIEKVYDEPLPIVSKRAETPSRKIDYPGYGVPEEHDRSIGIYRIVYENEVYIGSTAQSFRYRFYGHIYSGKPLVPTLMIEKGGVYELVEVMNGCSKEEILAREDYYIDLYEQDERFVLVNQRNASPQPPQPKYKRLMVLEDDYERALSLLEEHGIQLKPNSEKDGE